jgi:hypothetical protein
MSDLPASYQHNHHQNRDISNHFLVLSSNGPASCVHARPKALCKTTATIDRVV